MDYVKLPAPYGHGSSTLRNWIIENLRRDAEFRLPKQRTKEPLNEGDELDDESLGDEDGDL